MQDIFDQVVALGTEQANLHTRDLDMMSSLEIVRCMNAEDSKVAESVERCLPEIARAVDLIAAAMEAGGRLFYAGAGASGWLGKLDASEYPPTFGIAPERVQALLAGEGASGLSMEEAEDDSSLGAADLRSRGVCSGDVIVGISASGRTPYILGALQIAREVGAGTVCICCNVGSAAGRMSDVAIEVAVGPEVLSGSTRLKAGTAQKMVLNMLSTASMVRQGKVYRNLMINVRPDNEKLRIRAKAIVRQATGANEAEAELAYEQCGGNVGASIAMLLAGLDAARAMECVHQTGGRVREALQLAIHKGEQSRQYD